MDHDRGDHRPASGWASAPAMQRIPTILRHRIEDLRLKDLARSIGEFARERPVAFMGGAVLAGFALSRLLKKAGAPAKTGRGTQRPDL